MRFEIKPSRYWYFVLWGIHGSLQLIIFLLLWRKLGIIALLYLCLSAILSLFLYVKSKPFKQPESTVVFSVNDSLDIIYQQKVYQFNRLTCYWRNFFVISFTDQQRERPEHFTWLIAPSQLTHDEQVRLRRTLKFKVNNDKSAHS